MKSGLYAAASIAVLAIGSLPCTAAAQQTGGTATPAQTSGSAASDGGVVQEVVVTGSRVSRVGFVAPSPLVVVTTENLQSVNPGNLNDALRQLPALTSSAGPRGATGSGGSGGSFLNLRALGAARTLTLLDGRRFVPTTSAGSVDTALFPEDLIRRIDIVTGGASAAYGSDAVAGVVNFVLDKSFTGVKGGAMYGVVEGGYSPEYRVSAAVGTPFADGRGHFLADVEHYENDGHYELADMKKLLSHQWANECAAILNPGGATSRIYSCDVRLSAVGIGGLITSGALRGTTFDRNGNPIPFNFGRNTSNSNQVGGDGPLAGYRGLQSGSIRSTAFARGSWDLTDDVTVYAEANYGRTQYDYPVGNFSQYSGAQAIPIQATNPYVTPAMASLLAANRLTSFTIGRMNEDIPRPQVKQINKTERFAAGIDGTTLNTVWSIYYQHGVTHVDQTLTGVTNTNNFFLAVDAVRAADGSIVCRSTLTNPGNGCVPINVLGPQTYTAQQLAFVTGTNWFRTAYQQDVVAGSFSRDVFSLPAGAVSLAGGLEYRKESLTGTNDPTSTVINTVTKNAGPYVTGNYRVTVGGLHVTEGFLETVVPVFADAPFAKELTLNGAVRRTDYSTSGSVTTWKGGATWRPVEAIRFRVMRSRDIRAPNLNELFNPQSTNVTPTFTDQFYTPPRIYTGIVNIVQGNPKLQPEKGDTWTGGVVISPPSIPGLDIAIDGYDITIKGAIASLSGTQLTQACALGAASACAQTPRDAAGNVTTVFQVPINLAELKVSGIDVETQYRFSLSKILPAPGNIALRVLANYLNNNTQRTPGIPLLDHTGETGLPRFTATWSVTYRNGPFTLATNFRYTGSGPVDRTTLPTDLPQLKIPGQVLVSANANYQVKAFGGTYDVFFNVENLTNKIAPPFGSLNYYDSIGRVFRGGVKFRY